PFRIGLIVMAAAVAIAVQGWYNRTALTREVFVDRAGGRRVLRFGLSILALVVLSLTLGMYVAMAAYLFVMMRWQGRHSWLASIAVPLLYTAATWLVFERWFLVPLLKGPVEVWLGLA
ncbi:tripartite tricarboxylate transporter TctB family protein, partial [Roseomonas sp. DSM 102946]|nr:tripartite tricarboxylate transporter TctB family protein [Roseomonas sp. DSM 102946]